MFLLCVFSYLRCSGRSRTEKIKREEEESREYRSEEGKEGRKKEKE